MVDRWLHKHASKGQRRYRYYVSRSLHEGISKEGLRVPASELEPLVIEGITRVLERPIEYLALSDADLTDFQSLSERAGQLIAILRDRRSAACRTLVRELIAKIEVHGDRIVLKLMRSPLDNALKLPYPNHDQEILSIILTARIARTGRMVRLVDGGRRAAGADVNKVLVRLIARGRRWWQRLLAEPGLTVAAIAVSEGLTSSYVSRLIRLTFLSPDVLTAILEGRQLLFLDGTSITAPNAIALDWREQRRALLA